MEQSTKWYLIEAVSSARISRLHRPELESRRTVYHSFSGALSGLRYVNAISWEEHAICTDKMLIALGFTPPERRKTDDHSHFIPLIYLGDGDPSRDPSPLGQPSVLLRSIPGPSTEFEFHNGVFRLTSIEIFSDRVIAKWRMNDPPSVSEVFPEPLAALESDLEGLEDWAADELRRKAERHLGRLNFFHFSLSDDLGTQYESVQCRQDNRFAVMDGLQTFQPGPPHTAWSLTLSWQDRSIEFSLLAEGD
jgi:hypothetical protein